MNNDKIVIFLMNSDSNVKILLSSCIDNSDNKNKVEIFHQNDLSSLKKIKPDFLILDFTTKDELIKQLDYININFSELKGRIVLTIEKSMAHELIFIIDLGIREFIFKPFIHEEVYIRINNYINYMLAIRQSINKEIQFNALLNNTPYMAWFKDKDSNYIIANDYFKHHSGKTAEEICGRDDRFVWDGKIGDQCRIYDLQVMNERKRIVFNELIPGKKGDREFNIYKAPVTDEFNNVVGTIGVARDITEEKKYQEKIKQLALIDSLTEVGNRRLLYSYLEEKIYKKENLILGFIDLDNFKKANDIYGHNYGDQVIKYFAKNLKEIFTNSLITRIGGDEFVVVSTVNTDYYSLNQNIEKHFATLKDNLQNFDRTKMLSISIGIVIENGEKTSIEEIMAKGDFALYKAKEQGKNRYVFYTEELKHENMLNLQMENDLIACLENDEIKLFYQPQYSISKELVGFEALFRWQNEKYKYVPVDRVIRVIENSNLMILIGECILRKAFIFSNKINKNASKAFVISVNISPRQIRSKSFVDLVEKLIYETKVNTRNITFEITENVFIDNINESIEKLTKIKKLGITIALDDFGTGYSSLNYLVKLPIDLLKIDRSFITGIGYDGKYINIIKHITELAHTLSLNVVAEGIETQSEFDMMSNIGIDIIQGYLLGKPMEEIDALQLISKT